MQFFFFLKYLCEQRHFSGIVWAVRELNAKCCLLDSKNIYTNWEEWKMTLHIMKMSFSPFGIVGPSFPKNNKHKVL